MEYSAPQIAGRDEPLRSAICEHLKGRTQGLEDLAIEMLARCPPAGWRIGGAGVCASTAGAMSPAESQRSSAAAAQAGEQSDVLAGGTYWSWAGE